MLGQLLQKDGGLGASNHPPKPAGYAPDLRAAIRGPAGCASLCDIHWEDTSQISLHDGFILMDIHRLGIATDLRIRLLTCTVCIEITAEQ